MKAAALLFVILAGGIFSGAVAQVPQGTRLEQTRMNFYRDTPDGKKPLDFVVTGNSVTNLLVHQFKLKSFRNGDPKQIQIIAQAPQCQISQSPSMASDPGPLQVYTPTTNLFVQGVGFRFTQADHLLIISNNVETRVVKSLLRSSVLGAPRTNDSTAAGQMVKIFAEHGRFNLDSNVVDYSGNVHVIDPQLDMTCDLMTIHFTTNGTVENILARQNVVLTTTNNGRATGATGYYYVTDGSNGMMELTTDAVWRNGDEQAKANKFIYDSARHFLTAIGHVQVQWPNADPNSSRHATNSTALLLGTNGYRELFADYATLQFPTNNGPVESMRARGNVIIINQADQSSSISEQAVYEKSADSVELTGNPIWWNRDKMGNDQMMVKAETLTAQLGDKTYHARTHANFKMRAGGAVAPGHATNQWLIISSDDIDYQTNRAIFYKNVETRLVENDQLKDKLHCVFLTVNLTNNQVESAFARDEVYGETAPDAAGVKKTITCELLNAYRSVQTQLMKSIDAHTNVVIEEIGTRPGAPRNKLRADTVTAQFSAVTNQIEQAVAVQNVALDQFKAGQNTHATAERAVYTAANDQVKLTGAPLAHTEGFVITDSAFMIWQPKANVFKAFGPYKIVPLKQAAAPKSL
jgi:lipopolysaccharide export system protein LptA